MIEIVQAQTPGIGFAGSVILLMLALSFGVGQRLRPEWGLNWIAVGMAISGLRGLGEPAGLSVARWSALYEVFSGAYLAALAVGLLRYVGEDVRRPLARWLALMLGAQVAIQLGRLLGLGDASPAIVFTLLYGAVSLRCVRRLRHTDGRITAWAVAAVLWSPTIGALLGLGVFHLKPVQLPSWSSLPLSLIGLVLLMVTAGRLWAELQVELAGRRRAEDALRQLNESLEQRIDARTEELQAVVLGLESFNRMVSHDLRGPLGGLSGVALVGRKALHAGDTARAAQMLDLIGRETSRLGELVTQLLVLARVSNTELALCNTPLDQLLDEALQSLALSQGQASVQRVSAQPLPSADVDPQLMRQVFVNLIGNALKFSSQAQAPEVRVCQVPDEKPGPRSMVIEVRDNGPGFEPDQALQLFQPFHRLHGTRFEGSGIGLTIVRRIIERHGGQVWAEGRPAQGASFYFRLPVK